MPGATHDSKAITTSGVLEQIDPSCCTDDKGYIGTGVVTPCKKSPNGELTQAQKQANKALGRIRYVVEGTIAHIKAWKILTHDYRRPLHTLQRNHHSHTSPLHLHQPPNNLPCADIIRLYLISQNSALSTTVLEAPGISRYYARIGWCCRTTDEEGVMIDVDAVGREIEGGRAELAASDKAILSLATRKRIWEAMLDPQDDEASYRHRIELQVTCVRHVQHLWDRAFPGDDRVEEMLTLAQELIDQQADVRQADRRAGTFTVQMDNEVKNFNSITQPAYLVANGASHMVTSACYRNPDYDTAGDETDDDELLPDSLETSYCCASAAANALNWVSIEETGVPARRAFWTWYLDEAIPQALAS